MTVSCVFHPPTLMSKTLFWQKVDEIGRKSRFSLHQIPPWWNIARNTFSADIFNECSSLLCFFLRKKFHHSFHDLRMFSSWKKHPKKHEECHHVHRDEIVSFWKNWRSTELGLSIILHHSTMGFFSWLLSGSQVVCFFFLPENRCISGKMKL